MFLGSSIGIIGGADGPTAIFVTSSSSTVTTWVLAGLVLAILAGIAYLVLRKRK